MANVRRMSYRNYEITRDWLVDTAETPEDQKNLKKDLAALRKAYKQGRVEAGLKKAPAKKTVATKKTATVAKKAVKKK